MNEKKWIIVWFSINTFLLFVVGGFNYIIDPFQQYRKSFLYDVFFDIGKERYINPGLAKNYKYKSVVIGSSMTENFLISDLKTIMNNPIKLCISGASASEISTTLNTVFTHKKDIETVLIGLDMYALYGDKMRLAFGKNSLPIELYNDEIIDDSKYLFTIATTKESIESLIRPYMHKGDIRFNYENMYQWQHLSDDMFGKDKVLDLWNEREKNFDKDFKKSDWEEEKIITSFEYNIMSIIKKNPKTKFVIFTPPYSILTYFDWIDKGIINNITNAKTKIIEKLLTNKNVEIYDFQIDERITTNLNNYKDNAHYHQKINTFIVNSIYKKNPIYKTTKENYKYQDKEFIKYVYEYYNSKKF